jgi:hypothetical protein
MMKCPTKKTGHTARKEDVESLPLISISFTKYDANYTFNDPDFESRFEM